MLKKVMFFFIPVYKKELKTFLLMGSMLFFILFNYNVLRIVKDALIAPTIGVEAIAFIDTYLVIPASLLFALLYSYMSHVWSFKKCFYYLFGFFFAFFILFTCVLYPYSDAIHPTSADITAILSSKISIFGNSIDASHFKWIIKLYGKWTFAIFGLFAELFGSIFMFLFYWQLANRTTQTDAAKRLYPMSNFIGHVGTFLGGYYIQRASSIKALPFFNIEYPDYFMLLSMSAVIFSLVTTVAIFLYLMNSHTITIDKYVKPIVKSKLDFRASLKIVFSSRYLWLITGLVFFYGVSINLCENLWKSKLAELYRDTDTYAFISGGAIKWIGICSMVCMIISTHILRKTRWLISAIITPVVMLITGGIFFAFFMMEGHSIYSTLPIVVMLGTVQIVLIKGVKYALFDATKEMAFIPADEQIRSKGKAAVDVVGLRMAKASGSLVQSLLFMIFPMANYLTLAPYMIIAVAIICVLWIKTVFSLNQQYVALTET